MRESREPAWRRYLRLARPDAARDVDDELASHLAMREDEYLAAGMDRAAARRLAQERFGAVREAREACLAVDRRLTQRANRSRQLEALAQDARYGVRTLWQHRGFAAAVIATLALGIGATTAMFSAVDAALLRPLPFAAPERLVHVKALQIPFGEEADEPRITPDLASVAAIPGLFETMAGYAMGGLNLTGDGDPVRANVGVVTAGLFETLGVPAVIGRTFSADEGRPDGPKVAILSDGLWRRRFGAQPVLGRTIQLNGRTHEIVGVMPPGFVFPERSELWIPLTVPTTRESFEGFRGWLPVEIVARLGPGVTREAAANRVRDLWSAVPREFRRGLDDALREPVVPLRATLVKNRDRPLLILLGTTTLLLLIACANVTNLLLARAATRRREIALRAVLGASRSRIVRQLLVESLILSLAGSAAGLVLAFAGLGTVRALLPDTMAGVAPVTVDLRVLAFAVVLALLTAVAFGLWPALTTARTDAAETLKAGGHGATSFGAGGLRRALVIGELAITLTLVSGALLMLRSFVALLQTDPGFRAEQVGTVELAFARGQGAAFRLGVLRDALARLEAAPGIAAAGIVNDLPLRPGAGGIGLAIEAEHGRVGFRDSFARFLMASEGYFAALNIPLRSGRLMRPGDDSLGPRVVVINETMARLFWPDRDAVGQRIVDPLREPGQREPRYRTVVGVVGDVREGGLEREVTAQIYLPIYETTPDNAALVARGSLPAPALLARLRDAVRAARPDQAIYNLRTMDAVVARSRAPRRLNTTLLAAFGSLALLLAGVGVYGVVSYTVARRTRELGIRAALGATRGDLVRLVAREGLWLAAFGIALGLAGSYAFARALAGLLYAVPPQDPFSFVVAPALLAACVMAAMLMPSRRAGRLDPADVMRAD